MSQKIVRICRGARLVLSGVAIAAMTVLGANSVTAAGDGGHAIEHKHWTFSGLFGHFDKDQLQRGYQVYNEVCSSCHGLRQLYYRNLSEPGGPQFPVDKVKTLAATFEVDAEPNDDGDITNAQGERLKRPARPSDHFVSPFPNENAARAANGGALPPDLSLITRARDVHANAPFYMVPWNFVKNVLGGYQEGGADYLYALMVDYKENAPAGVTLAEGMYYNAAFPGAQIAMPPPISPDGFVTYQDGSGSLKKNAEDVTAFLAWAANPELEARKAMGFRVMIYLLIMSILLYLAKRRIWSRVEH